MFIFGSPLTSNAVLFTCWTFVHCFYSFIQSLPIGNPDLVMPKMEKLDFPRIAADSKKFRDSGVLTSEAIQWWKQFIETFEVKYCQLPTPTPPWILDTIQQGIHAVPVKSPVQLPEKISELRDTETQSAPVVFFTYYNFLPLCLA